MHGKQAFSHTLPECVAKWINSNANSWQFGHVTSVLYKRSFFISLISNLNPGNCVLGQLDAHLTVHAVASKFSADSLIVLFFI